MTSDPLTIPHVLPYHQGFTSMSSVATACLSNREPGSTGPQYSWEVQQCQCQECLHQGALRLTAAPSTHATVPKNEDFSSDFLANLVRAAQMSRVDTSHVLSMLMPSTQQPANSPGLPADGPQTTPGHVMTSPNWQDPPTGSSSSQGSSQGSLWAITHPGQHWRGQWLGAEETSHYKSFLKVGLETLSGKFWQFWLLAKSIRYCGNCNCYFF